MSSPSKRREMDLMKLWVLQNIFFIFEILGFYLFIYFIFVFLFLCFVWLVWTRMMSDYKVEMINDGMQEFYVDFHGPKESKSFLTHIFFFSFF